MKIKITLLLFFMALSIKAQTWTNVGAPNFTGIEAENSKLVLDSNNIPYVAYQDSNNLYKLSVSKFDGTNWVAVGAPGFASANNLDLVFDNAGSLYVVYSDDYSNTSPGITVKKFDGTTWNTVGSAGFTSRNSWNPSLIFDSNNVPYVAFSDNSNGHKTSVKKFNGTAWVNVGAAGFSAGRAFSQSLVIDFNNILYVAYTDEPQSHGVTVKKFNGTTWVTVGTDGFTTGDVNVQEVDLAIDSNNVPYVAYNDGANSNKMSAMKFNGTTWGAVGTPGFTAGTGYPISLSIDANNTPYVAYSDGGNTDKTSVKKFNGTVWETVGTLGFSDGRGQNQSIALDNNNVPYVSYTDDTYTQKLTVKKFNPIQRTLTITPPTNGTVIANIPPPNGTTYNDGAVVALTATPASGYLFTGWSGDASGTTNPLNITMGADKTVTATFTLITTTTWTGGAGGAWHVAGNWTNGVPTISTNAIIPTNNNNTPNPQITAAFGTAFVNNLEIQGSRPFTVSNGGALTIGGNLTQSGTIVINTSATSNGSLILKGTTSGFVTYNRHTKTSDWHLMSSPVLSESISRFSGGYSTSGNKYGIATYNNALSSSRYVYYTTAAGANNIASAGHFVAGKGYSIKTDFASIFPFTGFINANDVSVAITDGSATGNKWNLVGNPFTASINGNTNADAVNNFLTINANQLDPNRVAMYVWNGASYDIINNATLGSKHIAVAQGFFVESKDGGGTIQFTKAMQSHQTGDNFQRTSNVAPSIKLLVSNGDSQKSTDVKYFENSTTGLDLGYDAGVFSGDSMSFNVFTQLVSNDSTIDFGIQSLPTDNYENMVIPLGVKATENTTLSFSVAVENLPSDINVYLEDKVANTFTQLNTAQGSYVTTISSAVYGVGRFYIHTTSSVLGIENNQIALKSINIYKSNNDTLQITGLPNQGKNTVQIFNVLGKEVFNKSFAAQEKAAIKLPENISTGVYIVKLKTSKGSVHKKVILN